MEKMGQKWTCPTWRASPKSQGEKSPTSGCSEDMGPQSSPVLVPLAQGLPPCAWFTYFLLQATSVSSVALSWAPSMRWVMLPGLVRPSAQVVTGICSPWQLGPQGPGSRRGCPEI